MAWNLNHTRLGKKLILHISVLMLVAVNLAVISIREEPHLYANGTIYPINIYDPDPQHLWNRIYEQFYVRFADDGEAFGGDVLDPPLWYETQSVFINPAYQKTLDVLDEFLDTNGEELVVDPIKRAFFQRDLWAVFDWLMPPTDISLPSENVYLAERQALQQRIVNIMRRVALSKEEIALLPDTYRLAIKAEIFPTHYNQQQPSMPFLPVELGLPNSSWVNIGSDQGATAITHIQSNTFSGRSAFYVFYRLPAGRQATLDYIDALNMAKTIVQAPPLPEGTQVALIRQMLLIDKEGSIVPSPITESVQLRVFLSPDIPQSFFQFNLRRKLLFGGQLGGLSAVSPSDTEFSMFMAHGTDPFESHMVTPEQMLVVSLQFCNACHFKSDLSSIISYSRHPYGLSEPSILTVTSPQDEVAHIIDWKQFQASWHLLQLYWAGD